MRALCVEFLDESVEARLLLSEVHACRARGFGFGGAVHALVTAVLVADFPGLMRSMSIPSRSHQTESRKIEEGLAKGTPLSETGRAREDADGTFWARERGGAPILAA